MIYYYVLIFAKLLPNICNFSADFVFYYSFLYRCACLWFVAGGCVIKKYVNLIFLCNIIHALSVKLIKFANRKHTLILL